MVDRKQEEINFSNKREKDRQSLDVKSFSEHYSNTKFYSITRKSREYYLNWLKQNCKGNALDYCCGLGGVSLELARQGAFVYGVDISDKRIRTAEKTLAQNGYASQSKFYVMDAEKLKFDNDFFDIIVCSGVLHHLDVQIAFPELARVLKPDGKIICMEALGYNPVINFYRRRTLHLRTKWEAEHILTLREVKLAKKNFKKIKVNFFYLFSILAVPFRNTFIFNTLLTYFEDIDFIVTKIPLIKLLAWQMIFELSEPQKK